MLIVLTFIIMITALNAAPGDYCQKNTDCTGTSACCAYQTSLGTVGPIEFQCSTTTNTTWTCLSGSTIFSANPKCVAFPVVCGISSMNYGICGTLA